MPKISIIMNCYNGEEYLNLSLESVFAQTFTDWEIIFVDNCSTDKSATIAESFGDKVKYYKTEINIPLYEARNFGLQYVNSEFVAFLDVDDLWQKSKLEKQIDAFEDDIAVVCTNVSYIGSKGQKLKNQHAKLYSGDVTNKLLKKCFIAISSTLSRTVVLKDYKFDPQYNLVGDYEMWLRLSVHYKIKSLPEKLFNCRLHDSNLTKLSKGKWLAEMRSHYKKFIKENGFKYLNIFVYILRAEVGSLIGRL
jgi:glycosyltransferase involved in cell wall biosynthesis